MMRWQGRTTATGFAPFAAPTARTADGAPTRLASCAYDVVVPAATDAQGEPDALLERRAVELDLDFVEGRQVASEVTRQDADDPAGIAAALDRRVRIPPGERRLHVLADRTEVHQAHLRSPRRDGERANRRVGRGKGDRVHDSILLRQR